MFDPETEETIFEMTPVRLRAAQLCAEDQLTNAKIALECGITRRTLQNWLTKREFCDQVADLAKKVRRDLTAEFEVANLRGRIKAIQDRLNALQEIADARAEEFAVISAKGFDAKNPDAEVIIETGMETGYLCKVVTTVQTKEGTRTTVEFRPDYGLARAIADCQDQAAKHMGQLTAKMELGGFGGGPLRVVDEPDLSHLSLEELDVYESLLMKAHAGGDVIDMVADDDGAGSADD